MHLKVFTDARRSDPGKLAASCTSTTIKTTVTLKSHEKEGARSEPIKQAQTSARRMHSFYTIPMGCGYLPGGCERYSMVRGSKGPRTNDGRVVGLHLMWLEPGAFGRVWWAALLANLHVSIAGCPASV